MASDRRMTSSSLSQRTTAWSTPCCSVFSPSQPFRPQKISRTTLPARRPACRRCITAPTAIRSLCAANSNRSCDYTRYVIEKDWPAHRQARTPQGGEHRLQAIREALFSFEPKSKTQEVLHGGIIRQFNAMSVSREERLSAVSSSMTGVLWYVVIFGGVLTVVFLWMIHMEFIPQIFLVVLTAVFIGLMTFLIFAMDHPLQGAVSVGPRPFQSVYDLVMKWDESS